MRCSSASILPAPAARPKSASCLDTRKRTAGPCDAGGARLLRVWLACTCRICGRVLATGAERRNYDKSHGVVARIHEAWKATCSMRGHMNSTQSRCIPCKLWLWPWQWPCALPQQRFGLCQQAATVHVLHMIPCTPSDMRHQVVAAPGPARSWAAQHRARQQVPTFYSTSTTVHCTV